MLLIATMSLVILNVMSSFSSSGMLSSELSMLMMLFDSIE